MQVVVEGAGFEPAKSFRTPDLQSGGFNHSPTPPGLPVGRYRGPARSLKFLEPPRGLEPLTGRLQVDCATVAPQGPAKGWPLGDKTPRRGPPKSANRYAKRDYIPFSRNCQPAIAGILDFGGIGFWREMWYNPLTKPFCGMPGGSKIGNQQRFPLESPFAV